MTDYEIWRRGHSSGEWMMTSHNIKARTDKEAQAKVRRKFAGCGFTGMSLVAMPRGTTPNAGVSGAAQEN